jgi:hypothetical protein
MTTLAALTVLNRMAGGEVLYRRRDNGRVFFNPRQGGIVPKLLVQSMIAADLLTPGPAWGVNDTMIMTPTGEALADDPVKLLPRVKNPLPTLAWFNRLSQKVLGLQDAKLHDLVPTGQCLVWTGPVNTAGFAQDKLQGKTISLPRFMYEYTFGPLVAGHRIKNDSCHNPRCINPYHWVDPTNLKFKAGDPRAVLASIKRAIVAGDDDRALMIVVGIASLAIVPTSMPVPNSHMADVIDNLEYLYGTFAPDNWDELWVLLQPSGTTEAEAIEAIKKVGGDVAKHCSKPETK